MLKSSIAAAAIAAGALASSGLAAPEFVNVRTRVHVSTKLEIGGAPAVVDIDRDIVDVLAGPGPFAQTSASVSQAGTELSAHAVAPVYVDAEAGTVRVIRFGGVVLAEDAAGLLVGRLESVLTVDFTVDEPSVLRVSGVEVLRSGEERIFAKIALGLAGAAEPAVVLALDEGTHAGFEATLVPGRTYRLEAESHGELLVGTDEPQGLDLGSSVSLYFDAAIEGACIADLDGSGEAGAADLLAFLGAFRAGCPAGA